MYYVWYKIASILATGIHRQLPNIDEEVTLPFRVRLFDCDGFRIMSGFQYPVYMGLSSWALCTRTNFAKPIFSKKLTPVAASQKYICRKPLKLWSSFSLKVSFAGWDNKWFYHQHIFVQNNEVSAIGTSKLAAWHRRKIVPVPAVFDAIGYDYKVMNPPDWVANQFIEDNDSYKNVVASL
jgi:acyl-CoA thioesterase FadM